MVDLAIKVKVRADTAANWIANNPVLDEQEMAVELDPGIPITKMKIGNGVDSWNSLSYIGGTPSFPGVDLMARFTTVEKEKIGKLLKGVRVQTGSPPAPLISEELDEFIAYAKPIPREVTDPYVVTYVNEMENTLGILDPGRAATILTP